MNFFGLFGGGNSSKNIKEYLESNAVIIDVRTANEYKQGHANGSKNIVLNTIPNRVQEIKKMNRKVIAVCKSGGRSQQATAFLKQNGIDAINGGPWQNVAKFLN